jgi:hypothetical protein
MTSLTALTSASKQVAGACSNTSKMAAVDFGGTASTAEPAFLLPYASTVGKLSTSRDSASPATKPSTSSSLGLPRVFKDPLVCRVVLVCKANPSRVPSAKMEPKSVRGYSNTSAASTTRNHRYNFFRQSRVASWYCAKLISIGSTAMGEAKTRPCKRVVSETGSSAGRRWGRCYSPPRHSKMRSFNRFWYSPGTSDGYP